MLVIKETSLNAFVVLSDQMSAMPVRVEEKQSRDARGWKLLLGFDEVREGWIEWALWAQGERRGPIDEDVQLLGQTVEELLADGCSGGELACRRGHDGLERWAIDTIGQQRMMSGRDRLADRRVRS